MSEFVPARALQIWQTWSIILEFQNKFRRSQLHKGKENKDRSKHNIVITGRSLLWTLPRGPWILSLSVHVGSAAVVLVGFEVIPWQWLQGTCPGLCGCAVLHPLSLPWERAALPKPPLLPAQEIQITAPCSNPLLPEHCCLFCTRNASHAYAL